MIEVSWQHWIVIALILLGSLLTVTIVGKPRKPISGGQAAFTILFNMVVITLIITGS